VVFEGISHSMVNLALSGSDVAFILSCFFQISLSIAKQASLVTTLAGYFD